MTNTSPDERANKAVRRVVALAQLSPGWDSYGGKAIREHALMKALVIAGELPEVVPVSDGGAQVEWHLKGFDIEIRIPGDPFAIPEIFIKDNRDGR